MSVAQLKKNDEQKKDKMIYKKWQNEKELTRHSARRCGGQGAVFPTGMKRKNKTKIESWRFKTSFSPYFANKTSLVANELTHIYLQPHYLIKKRIGNEVIRFGKRREFACY